MSGCLFRAMAIVLPGLSVLVTWPSCINLYLHLPAVVSLFAHITDADIQYSLFSACAISYVLPEMSGSQCLNWSSLCNLYPQLLEIRMHYKIYLNIDFLCLLAVDLFGRNSHLPHCEIHRSMVVSIPVDKSDQAAFHGA